MQMMDCVEVIVEKESYAREGVHKGMQALIRLFGISKVNILMLQCMS